MREFYDSHKKLCITCGIIISVLIFAVYLYALFLPGYWYRDVFLYKQKAPFEGIELYSGHDAINSVDYEMTMAKDGMKTYIAFTVGETEREYEVNSDNSKSYNPAVEIYENGELVFKGTSLSGMLLDENDIPYFETPVMNYYTGDTLSEEELLPTYGWLYSVSQEKNAIRGNILFLPAIIIVAAVVVFDMMHPDVFWQMRNCLDVEGGRPSDYFRFMQKLSWKISPFIIISLMIASFVIKV